MEINVNLENTCYSNQGSVSRAGEQTETADEPGITSKVQSVQKIYAGEGNVFIAAYKRSEIYGSMRCQGLGMRPMFIFHVKKMFLKVLRRRYYMKSWQCQEGKEGEMTD